MPPMEAVKAIFGIELHGSRLGLRQWQFSEFPRKAIFALP